MRHALSFHVQLRQSLGWTSVLVGVAPSSSGGGAVALDANGAAAAAAMFTPTPNARNRAMLAECKRFAKRVRALHGDLSSWSKHVGGAHETATGSCMLEPRLHGQRDTSYGRCHACKPVKTSGQCSVRRAGAGRQLAVILQQPCGSFAR